MTVFFRRLFAACCFGALAIHAWPAFAAPSVGAPVMTPGSVNVGVLTQVTTACQVTRQQGDPEVLANGVNLLRLAANGTVMATWGVMRDDGQAGDAVAGDSIFTYRYPVNEAQAGQIRLQCSAAFRGTMLRVRSPIGLMSVDIFQSLPDATPRSGQAPLTVTFTTRGQYTGGQILRYRWDFEGDGTFDTSEPGARDFTRTFTTPGIRNATLEILNDKNQTTTATVPVTVSGNPPTVTASVNPSNGPVPLNVTFSGSATPGGAPIARYEWDFDGNGTFDYSSTTTGNTSFVYTSEGTHNATFTVTDTAGLTGTARVSATAIRVGPPGSPTATITAPATPQTRNAPATISFNGTGSDPGGSIAQYAWDFEGDGTYDFTSTSTASTSHAYTSPGTFVVAFRVTDNEGRTGIDTVEITINIAATLTVSTDTLRPPGTVTVNTTLGGATQATVFLRNKAGQTVRTLVSGVARNAGSYTDVWDGTDDGGATVPEGEYFAILQYLANGVPVLVDRTNTSGNQFYNPSWSLATTTGGSCSNCAFAPYADNFLEGTFTVPQASEVTVSIRGFDTVNEVALLFDRRPFGRGAWYTVVWDGTNALGEIVHPSLYGDSQFIFGMTAFTLPLNAIFVERAPSLSNVSMTPNYYDPYTGDFSRRRSRRRRSATRCPSPHVSICGCIAWAPTLSSARSRCRTRPKVRARRPGTDATTAASSSTRATIASG